MGHQAPVVNRASPAVDQALETGVVVDQVNQERAGQVLVSCEWFTLHSQSAMSYSPCSHHMLLSFLSNYQ